MTTHRRGFLGMGAVAGAGLLVPWHLTQAVSGARAAATAPGASPSLTKYVDPLPIPAIIRPIGTLNGNPYFEVAMTQFRQKLHRDLPPTTLWGYNGAYPGPTFHVPAGLTCNVRWINNLPTEHIFASSIDPSIHGAKSGTPAVRTVVHLHGGHTPPNCDGYAESWFTPGHSALYTYPNAQQATMLWYHDHALGSTRLNVAAGLAGMYFVRDAFEASLNLPRGAYEIPLLIQDRIFNDDGSIYYPPAPWASEYWADTPLVNGKVYPYLEVQPRKYRFRVLNACNARFLNLTLDNSGNGGLFQQIGTDGGLLPAPVSITELLLGPAERADLVIDFSMYAGQTITVRNSAVAPFPSGGGGPDIPEIMQFRVSAGAVVDQSALPMTLRPLTALSPSSASQTRDIVLRETLDANGNSLGLTFNGKMWSDPVTETPAINTVEIWRLINTTVDAHPIHIHLVEFLILDRQTFDVPRYKATGQLVFTGPPVPPEANEAGWKDVVRINPQTVARIIMRFSGYRGTYMYHCHILEHEENEMMRPFQVV